MAGLLSVDWRADLTVATSSSSSSSSSAAPLSLSPTVQLKLRLDNKPERGRIAPGSSAAQQQGEDEEEEGRVGEVAFELGADKLDVLVQELDRALALMEA